MKRYVQFFLLLLVFILGCDSCEDDNGITNMNNQRCTTRCTGESSYEDGRCVCWNQEDAIRPGFCLQSQYKNTFITYDTPLPCADTFLVSFDIHPLDENVTWGRTDGFYDLTGFGYYQNPNAPQSNWVGLLKQPEDTLTNRIDSIFILPMFSANGKYCSFQGAPGEEDITWYCHKTFVGTFASRDLIVGEFQFRACGDVGSTNVPDSVYLKYPMTFHRLN
ncbi:MAG: hypothetical protein AAF828_12640 [Bacteroidota bacterium]